MLKLVFYSPIIQKYILIFSETYLRNSYQNFVYGIFCEITKWCWNYSQVQKGAL